MKRKIYLPVVAGIVALIALAIGWGGTLCTDLVERGIRDGVSELNGASIVIGDITGNPFKGYRLTSLRLMDGSGVTVATVRTVSAKLDLRALLERRIRLSYLDVNGVGVEEMLIRGVIPEERDDDETVPIDVDRLTVSDVSPLYGGGWYVSELKVLGNDSSWSGEVDGKWREESVTGMFDLDISNGIDVRSASIGAAGGKLVLSGKVSPDLDVSGRLEGLSMERLWSLIPVFGEIGFRGRADLEYRLSGSLVSPDLSGDLFFSDGEMGELPLPSVRGNLRFAGGLLSLSSCRVELGRGKLSGDISVGLLSKDHPVTAELEASDLDLASFSSEIQKKGVSIDIGRLSLSLNGPAASLNGEVDFDGVNASIDGCGLSKIEGKVSIKKGTRFGVKMKSPLTGGKVSLEGSVDMDEGDVDMAVSVRKVDLAPLSGFWRAGGDVGLGGFIDGDARISGTIGNPRVEGNVSSGALKIEGGALGRTAASFRYEGDLFRIVSFSSALGSGGISGAGVVNFGKTAAVRLEGKLSGLSGSAIEKAFPAMKGKMPDGIVSGGWSYDSTLSGGTVNLDLESRKLTFVKVFPLENIRTGLTLNDRRLQLREFKAGLYGGKIAMSGTGSILGEDLSVEGNLAGLDGKALFGAMGGLAASGKISGNFRLSGAVSSPKLDFSAQSDQLDLAGLPMEKMSLSLKSEKDSLVANLIGLMGGYPIKGSGWVRLPSGKDGGALDLQASVKGLDIRSLVPDDIEMGGTLFGKIHLLGPLNGPKLYLQGMAPRIQVGNMAFVSVDMGGYLGRGSDISFQASSLFGDRRIQASCDLIPSGSDWGLDFDASGSGVSVSALAPALQDIVDGRVDLKMSGSWKGGKLSASGKASSEMLSSHGVKVDSVSLPLVVDGSSVRISNGRAGLYGGNGRIDLSVDLGKNSWKGKAEVSGIDVKPLVKDGFDLPGTISGDVDVKLDLSGIAGKAFLIDVNGFLKGRSIELSDFSVLETVTKGAPLRIKDLAASFNLDGQAIYILPGSRASAWPGDDFYRYVDVSGSVWNNGYIRPGKSRDPLDLTCSGEVNLKALNALLGAMRNLLEATIENIRDPKSLATDLLAGIVGGYSAKDFREINLHLGGNWDSPVISKMKIGDKGGMGGFGDGLPSTSGGGETKIKIKVDIPTGNGGGAESDAGDQVKQQILENILKQVIGDQDKQDQQ